MYPNSRGRGSFLGNPRGNGRGGFLNQTGIGSDAPNIVNRY